MIMRFLSNSSSFAAVAYNLNKIEEDAAELIEIANFGLLKAIRHLRTEDYCNYLHWVSSLNERVKNIQLHAVISSKKKSNTKEELAMTARAWLREMGYAAHPYLLIFHKDTLNNHIHIVSTHVGKKGIRISDSFSWFRAAEAMHRVTGKDMQEDLKDALLYTFSNRDQFLLLMKSRSYYLRPEHQGYAAYKYRRLMKHLNYTDIDKGISLQLHLSPRLDEIRTLFLTHRIQYDTSLQATHRRLPGGLRGKFVGYSSEMSAFLKTSFGIETIFQYENGRVNGYTIIDHPTKQVFEGEMLMQLSRFASSFRAHKDEIYSSSGSESNYPAHEAFFSGTPGFSLPEGEIIHQAPGQQNHEPLAECQNISGLAWFDLKLSDDVDDEALHGHRRNRKKAGK